MNPGPRPMPTELKILTGNRGKRPLNDREPKPTPATPTCPDEVQDLARVVWDRIIPELTSMGVLTKIDGETVARYCIASAEWYRASTFIRDTGQTYTSKDSKGRVLSVNPWPQIAIATKYASIMKWCEAELGMTPSSRTRIRTEPFAEVDEFAAFLNADRE